ncbi:MAG: VWA domain-containing protein [Acidobacteriota bacterium]
MRRQSLLWQLAAAAFLLLALITAVSAQTAEVYFGDQNTRLEANSPAPTGHIPVLFVHGHNIDDAQDADFNYQKNWQNSLGGLPSFKQAMDLADNSGLDIEEYYIRFVEQGRSIATDAVEICDAIDLILHRHDSNFAYPHVVGQTTQVKVVIIAYSKGTLSARLYLKSLETLVTGMRAPETGFRPVSEFVAIAPPNHGLNLGGFGLFTTAGQQLVNGYGLNNCASIFPSGTDFIENLNSHPIEDSEALDVCEFYASEAPGSRSPVAPVTDGILYVTLFADQNRDFVGGETPSNDCQGRRLALNLSPDAVNIPLASITGSDVAAVHQNTVHTPEVICQALYTAVRHRTPVGQTCTQVGGVPVIPTTARAAAMLTLDFSGSMSAPACVGCGTRADTLKQSVELFIQLWSAVSVPSDRLGVTYFRTNVDPFLVGGEDLPLLSVAGNTIKDDVIRPTQLPSDWTAMGGGLQVAIEALKGVPADSRRVILFTDGIQNVNPMVLSPDCRLVIDSEVGRMNSNVSPTTPRTVVGPSTGIAVDTIGIGADPAFVALLSDIAGRTGGRTWLTTEPDDALRQFFVEQLIVALRGSSPQLVAYRHGAIGANGSREVFAIEAGARTLVLKVSWKPGQKIDFTVARNGVDVTSAGRFIQGTFYKIFVIDLKKASIGARGNWELRIQGKAGISYQTAAIVDGGQITYDAVFNVRKPRVGAPLELIVQSTAEGKPIGADSRVMVTLLKPAKSARGILAGLDPKTLPTYEPGATVLERRQLALVKDPEKLAALKPTRETLILKRSGKGDFRTRFRPDLPGVYTAHIIIYGESANLGKFSRTMTATAVVTSTRTRPNRPKRPPR